MSLLHRVVSVLAAATALLGATEAQAFEVKHTSGGLPVHWAASTVTFEIDPSVDANVPGGSEGVANAMAGWSTESGAPAILATAGSGSSGPAVDGHNVVYFAANGYAKAGGALAVTLLSYDDRTGEIVDADIVINGAAHDFAVLADGTTADPGEVPVSTEGGGGDGDNGAGDAHGHGGKVFDLVHVVAHETGHALGLSDDTGAPGALLYVYTTPNDASARTPTADDLAGITALYEGSGGQEGNATSPASGKGCSQSSVAPRGPSRSAAQASLFGLAALLAALRLADRARRSRGERLTETRRVFERLPLEVEVSLESDHNFYTGFSANISEGGIFIATHLVRPPGATLEIAFTLPGDDTPITAVAEVRWHRELNERSDTPPGLGMRFVKVAERDLTRIQAFIEKGREPLFYED